MKMVKILVGGLVSAVVLAVVVTICLATASDPKPTQAVVVFNVGNTKSNVKGSLLLSQIDADSPVLVTGEISGLTNLTTHGFHVHESGDIRDGCMSAGGHYNPLQKVHGAQDSEERHIGDLGNIKSDGAGVARISVEDKQLTMFGEHSIIGRAFVVHEKEDDLGKGGDDGSKKTGNAGSRLACGIIGTIYQKP